MKNEHRILTMKASLVYPLLIQKAEKKGRTKAEVDEIYRWLTGYSQAELEAQLAREVTYTTFFEEAPRLNPAREKITGLICGIRVENIEDPIIQNARYLDKLIDELAKGKAIEKILRTTEPKQIIIMKHPKLDAFSIKKINYLKYFIDNMLE